MGYSSVGEAIPQLANLTYRAPNWSPILAGGQNFTHCCLVAVNQSLNVNGPNGSLAFNNPSYFANALTISELEASIAAVGVPCGAHWNGDYTGSPVVRVSYVWCLSECGGWQKSVSSELSQWVGPLVQFIIPSLAFCLNVPRARKLATPDSIFLTKPGSLVGFVTYLPRLAYALFLMTVDTVIWLSVCFAYAGPMLFSAVYEYMLDRKVLEFLSPQKSKKDHSGRPVISRRLRAQLLLAVVVGNLRLSTSRRNSTISGASCQSQDLERAKTRTLSTISAPPAGNTWSRVMTILDEDDVPVMTTTHKVSLSAKMKAILNSQADFGETIGAPILFFVGAFIYTSMDIQTNDLGDNDSAHALAFGMWYMTVPCLAIISCAMLASGDPTALLGMVWDGGEAAAKAPSTVHRCRHSFQSRMEEYTPSRWLLNRIRSHELLQSTFEGNFETASLWNRGPNKRRWVQEAIRDYRADYAASHGLELMGPEEVSRALQEKVGEVVQALGLAVMLLVMPSALAFITSYNTPRKGISCRTLTYMVYGICQVAECLLWTWEVWLKKQYGERWTEAHTRAKTANYCGQLLFGFWAVFAAVVGTLMQLLGVYRTCACMVPFSYWIYPHAPASYVDLSTDDHASLLAARQYWIPTSIAAVSLISLLCAVGWWHQRGLRELFRAEADSLDHASLQMSAVNYAIVEAVDGVEVMRQGKEH